MQENVCAYFTLYDVISRHCRVNVSGLTASSNVTTIAKQLIAQCNLIQPSRLPELEQLLMYLQKRKVEKKGDFEILKYLVAYNYIFLQTLKVLVMA